MKDLNVTLEKLIALYRKNEEVDDEILDLLEEVKAQLAPLLRQAINAGVLSIDINHKKYLKGKYKMVYFDIADIYDNGKLVLTIDSDEDATMYALNKDFKFMIKQKMPTLFETISNQRGYLTWDDLRALSNCIPDCPIILSFRGKVIIKVRCYAKQAFKCIEIVENTGILICRDISVINKE